VTDIATIYDPVSRTFDWALDGSSLLMDDGLETAIILSFFCDRRADDGDTLPGDAVGPFGGAREGSGDRRGWWGDFMTDQALSVAPGQPYPVPADRWGSRFWLLARRKMTSDLPGDVEAYAVEALRWMVDRGIAGAITASAVASDGQTIRLSGEVTLASGKGVPFRFAVPVGEN
jgi:phage gp46-like protein